MGVADDEAALLLVDEATASLRSEEEEKSDVRILVFESFWDKKYPRCVDGNGKTIASRCDGLRRDGAVLLVSIVGDILPRQSSSCRSYSVP
jgi:hypothetical protein